jgi:hypothetical protein
MTRRNMKLPAAAIALTIASTGAIAKPALAPDYVACQSEKTLEEMVLAIGNHDEAAIRSLSNQCLVTTQITNLPITVIESRFPGITKILVYRGDSAVELWTLREAIRDR